MLAFKHIHNLHILYIIYIHLYSLFIYMKCLSWPLNQLYKTHRDTSNAKNDPKRFTVPYSFL